MKVCIIGWLDNTEIRENHKKLKLHDLFNRFSKYSKMGHLKVPEIWAIFSNFDLVFTNFDNIFKFLEFLLILVD